MNRWPVLAEFRSLGVLAVPIIITQLAQMGMGVADAIMAGRVSATELAGISLGGNLYWPLMLPAMLAYVALRCLAIDRSSGGRGTSRAPPLAPSCRPPMGRLVDRFLRLGRSVSCSA